MQQFLREYLEIYGYWVLFVGTFLEGETILVMAGFLAFQGYLDLMSVIAISTVGAFLGDQFYFHLGRWQGRKLLQRFLLLAKKLRGSIKFIEKYGPFVTFISRYTYGFRIVLPIVLGMSRMPETQFLVLNLLSAISWGAIFATGGYFIGKSASLLVDDVSKYEPYLIGVIMALFGVMWLVHFIHIRQRSKPARQRLKRIKELRKHASH